MAVFAIVMILIDVENIRLGKYIIGAATFFVAAVSLVAVWALDYFKNVYRVCRIAAVILLVLAVPIIFMGANDGFSLLWYLLLPVITLILLGILCVLYMDYILQFRSGRRLAIYLIMIMAGITVFSILFFTGDSVSL